MALFQWISVRPLPAAWDLRRGGWRMALGEAGRDTPVVRLIDAGMGDARPYALPPALRSSAIVIGLSDSAARALWLAAGFSDALPGEIDLAELEQRAARAIAPPGTARRRLGCLTLDLLARDARVEGRRLYLHPREFAVLWRLAEAHGAPVSRRELLRDVFDLSFDPGTNRLAVHICRLRKKLALAGLADLVATSPDESGYRMVLAAAGPPQWDERGDRPQRLPPEPLISPGPEFALDEPPRLGEQTRPFEELVR